MFSSTYSKILHDPECQANCCSRNFGKSIQVNKFNDMQLHRKVKTCVSDDIRISNSCKHTNVHISEYQVVPGQSVIDNFGNRYSHLFYEKPTERTYYPYKFTSISLTEAPRNQKTYCKGGVKRKRKRTVFTTEQIVVMEGVFKKRPYVSREERLFLTQKLMVSEKAIKIWFQNRRRVTDKNERDQSDSCHSDSTTDEVCNDYISRLDYIETQIKQNTDEFGFVTLNSKAITELVKLIDSVLSHDFDSHITFNEGDTNEEQLPNYIMYEPISPESFTDDHRDNEDISKWEPSQPEESLQRLIDIQNVLFN